MNLTLPDGRTLQDSKPQDVLTELSEIFDRLAAIFAAGGPKIEECDDLEELMRRLGTLMRVWRTAGPWSEADRLRPVAEQVRTVRYTLMHVHALLNAPVTEKNIADAKAAIEPLYQDALRDVKAERAAKEPR